MKMMLLSNISNEMTPANTDILMKIFLIERMCKSVLVELDGLKKSLIGKENQIIM